MSIHAALYHRTSYVYDRPAQLSPQVIRLRPAPHSRTSILSYSLTVTPSEHFINWQQDPLGNFLARVVFPEPVSRFEVEVDLVAEMAVLNPFDFFLEEHATSFPFDYGRELRRTLDPYLEVEPAGPLLAEYLPGIDRRPRVTADFLVELNQQLQQHISYLIRMEPGVQTPEETLRSRAGSCRDTAWLLVQILRHLGLAARFASGYLIQLVPDQKPLEGPTGPESDFTDLHAWAEVFLPGAGWIGLDATSGLMAGEGHIPLACAPDPTDAAPISGKVEPIRVDFSHEMKVTRVYEAPRVTKPYTEEAWRRIDALGHRIDSELADGDVRLTMGGEPTFVSIDDFEGEEWNSAALGPEKRRLAVDLVLRLCDRFAPQGVVTFGQGKQYPGEPLVRWAFGLIWRGDGRPVWRHPELIARDDVDHRPTLEGARSFAERICARLELDSKYLLPAYEDPLEHIQFEQGLPVNLDPGDDSLDQAAGRARLAAALRRGLSSPKAFVLPVQRWQSRAGPSWVTGPWPFRGKNLYLLPGDAPVGLRLPLDALPHIPPSRYPYYQPADPFSLPEALPDPAGRRQPWLSGGPTSAQPAGTRPQEEPVKRFDRAPRPGDVGYVSDEIRTALAVEPRDGRLCVYLPPVASGEDWLELVAVVEDVAAELDTPVHIEGYTPPPDPRLNVIKVTPDPGVIEVNVHPSGDWPMLSEVTSALYEEARQTRLATEKFMLDGRHVGTGGGNHIVVGGPTPADSPFLRRPDLLGSLIRYWQNHPSLSYLFSGLFIGPTSQAPRVDEARDDTLYELEIALAQLPEPGREVPLWLVDRVLRNLLIDVTGNTHRAEICIDKLYAPEGPAGRLGLVEFRGFEMPPHWRMSLAQQLLLRGLIAWFWREPYTRPLVRHGDRLRDRYMLPYFVWQDFLEVLRELNGAGLPFEEEWFHPHFEFRFPRMGEVSYRGISLELRTALEPWHVMGEEPGAGGTVRYADSSVERLQAKVAGLTDLDRFVVVCNGRRLPLQDTGVDGEGVAGVRFRAWQPPFCLHPTISVHSPLVFDLIDVQAGHSLGGCRYHVAHPGGRSYDTFPVNAAEAASRRLARFEPRGHTPGGIQVPGEERNPRYPCTLDLRYPGRFGA
ncbi:MAG: transglutaminase family protein [Acetobacterales bacterium]